MSTGSPRTSRIRFLDRSRAPIERPREWTPALIELLVPREEASRVHLSLQGRALEVYWKVVEGEERAFADWERAGAGRHRLVLRTGASVEAEAVEIAPEKITPAAFEQLLADLETRLPASVALGLQATGGLAGVELAQPEDVTLAGELQRLRRAVRGSPGPGLTRILEAIAPDPHRMLRPTGTWVARRRARRILGPGLVRSLWRADNLAPDGLPGAVLDARVEHSVDVYENRLVAAYAETVAARLRALSRLTTRPELAGEAAAMLAEVERARSRAAFLEQVGPLRHPPKRVTMVLLKRPPYRAALEGYRALLQSSLVRLHDERLESPLQNLPALYELWGTLLVVEALLEAARRTGYRIVAQDLIRRLPIGLCVDVLPAGRPLAELAHEDGVRVRLHSQRSYLRSRDAALHSISFPQRPDVALEVCDAEGGQRVFILDPKYKLDGEERGQLSDLSDLSGPSGRPKKVDIDKMHAYRDAIRGPNGQRTVAYAAILYPGPDVAYATGLEALRAIPSDAAPLRAALVQRIEEWIRPAPTPD